MKAQLYVVQLYVVQCKATEFLHGLLMGAISTQTLLGRHMTAN